MSLTLTTRTLGQRRASTVWPLTLAPLTPSLTLYDLIVRLVEQEVAAFNTRQTEQTFLQVLSPGAIEVGAAQGKISPGGRDEVTLAMADEAIVTALQAFEDGFYYVFVDEVQLESLDAPVTLHKDSHLLFLRLMPLAGG